MEDIEIAVQVLQETEKACLVYEGTKKVWISRSVINGYTEDRGRIVSVFIPDWLAEQKGLI